MLIIFGSRLTGKVDDVPGLFHVATRFGHIYYLPLIPLQSYVVLGRDGQRFRGVPIRLNMKSVLLAWARGFTSLGAVVAVVVTWANWRSADWTNWAIPACIGTVASGLFVLSTCLRSATRASFRRACELAQKIGMNEAGMAEIYRIYGAAADRGFDVATAAARGGPSTELPDPIAMVPFAATESAPAPQPLASTAAPVESAESPPAGELELPSSAPPPLEPRAAA